MVAERAIPTEHGTDQDGKYQESMGFPAGACLAWPSCSMGQGVPQQAMSQVVALAASSQVGRYQEEGIVLAAAGPSCFAGAMRLPASSQAAVPSAAALASSQVGRYQEPRVAAGAGASWAVFAMPMVHWATWQVGVRWAGSVPGSPVKAVVNEASARKASDVRIIFMESPL